MPVTYAEFEKLKEFIHFDDLDATRLHALDPIVQKHGGDITDAFYDTLGETEETAGIIDGRVDALKKTHRRYLGELTAGDYGEAYFDSRARIGQVHVQMGIDPRFVEGVMSTIRTGMLAALATELDDPVELAAHTSSFIKICDLDLAIINLAYGEERLDRFSEFTGMSRRLIENVIKVPKK